MFSDAVNCVTYFLMELRLTSICGVYKNLLAQNISNHHIWTISAEKKNQMYVAFYSLIKF